MAVVPFLSSPPASKSDAHGVRARPYFVPTVLDDYDLAGDEIIQALLTGPARSFDIDGTVVVSGSILQPTVIVRMDGRAWTLPSLEAALLALRIRLEPDLRAADLFADAFALASRRAEARLSALHDWSAGVRPTQDIE